MKTRILVVDDNLLNRKLACDLLELEGYEVRSCEDAEQAQEVLAQEAVPDLILMDLSLPGMDGLTLTRRLKADARFASVPIVAFTALAMKGDEEKALQAGCSGYIAKPIDIRRLPAQVAGLLAAKASQQRQLKIMIVEDYRVDLKLAGDSARLSGHVVLSSMSTEEALKELSDAHPDVVLLDLNLPGMDGPDFLQLLRSNPQTCMLLVVAVTAFPDDFRRDEMLAAGCKDFLVKPIDRHRLIQALEAACGLKGVAALEQRQGGGFTTNRA
jgi:two-component system cell cycle response regulator